MSELIKCPNCGESIYIPDEKPNMADLEPLGYEQLSPEERAELLNG